MRKNQTLEEFYHSKSFSSTIPVAAYRNELWISAPDILRYMGAKVGFGEDENADIHMYVSMPFTVLELYQKYTDAAGYFTVNADGSIVSREIRSIVDFAPMEQFITEDGYVYQSNQESGLAFPILSPSDYAVLGTEPVGEVGDSTAILIEFIQAEDHKVYCLLQRCVVDKNYGGWRTAYMRDKSVMLMRDMATGETTVLYTIP